MDKDELDINEARKRFDLAYKNETAYLEKDVIKSVDRLLGIKEDIRAMELYWAFRKGYAVARAESGDYSHV